MDNDTYAETETIRILVVEDDAVMVTALQEQFAHHDDYRVAYAPTHADIPAGARFDIALLATHLLAGEGRFLLDALRAAGVPIVFLADAQSEDAPENTLIKPFRFGVLLARIQTLLRQYAQSDAANVRLGPYLFKPALKILERANGEKIRLTEKETEIIRYLHRARLQTVSREALLKAVWGYSPDISTHTLETHIYRLRRKLDSDPAAAQLLCTDGGGYRLMP